MGDPVVRGHTREAGYLACREATERTLAVKISCTRSYAASLACASSSSIEKKLGQVIFSQTGRAFHALLLVLRQASCSIAWVDLHVTLRLSSNASTKVPLLHWSLSEIGKTLY